MHEGPSTEHPHFKMASAPPPAQQSTTPLPHPRRPAWPVPLPGQQARTPKRVSSTCGGVSGALALAACRQSAPGCAGGMIALLRCRATDMRVAIRLAMELLAPPGAQTALVRCARNDVVLHQRSVARGVYCPQCPGQADGIGVEVAEALESSDVSECGPRRTCHASLPLPC